MLWLAIALFLLGFIFRMGSGVPLVGDVIQLAALILFIVWIVQKVRGKTAYDWKDRATYEREKHQREKEIDL